MIINEIPFNVELVDIIRELQSQLIANQIPLLSKIKETPNDVMVSCPYHKEGQERRPSAGIRKSDGLFHCFTCNEVHSLEEFISHCLGYDEDILGTHGWEWLTKNFLTVSVEQRRDLNLDLSRTVCTESNNNFITEEELDSYRYYHPYMWERKLTKEIVELFDVGYDKKTNCLTFPVRNIYGNTLFIARRSVKSKFFNYPFEVEKPLYGIYELNQVKPFAEEVIVCESMIDALSCWVWGKYAVALNGLGTDLQFKQLQNLPCRKLILATDNDAAGEKARKRIRYYVKNKIITQFVFPPNRKDINELTEEEFKNLQEIF